MFQFITFGFPEHFVRPHLQGGPSDLRQLLVHCMEKKSIRMIWPEMMRRNIASG